MAGDLREFVKTNRPKGSFKPRPYYSEIGDFLSYHFTGEDFYAKRVDDCLTVYLSMKGDKFVGFKFKSIRHIIEALEGSGFKREYDLSMGIISLACMETVEDRPTRDYYRRIYKTAGRVPIRRKDLEPALV